MACMDHECSSLTCDWCDTNNAASVPGGCPKCGSHVISSFDEEPEYDDYERADCEEEN